MLKLSKDRIQFRIIFQQQFYTIYQYYVYSLKHEFKLIYINYYFIYLFVNIIRHLLTLKRFYIIFSWQLINHNNLIDLLYKQQ